MTVLIALAAGVLIGYLAKGGAVWDVAEQARYYRNELLAAELHIRFQRWRRSTPGAQPRALRRSPLPPRGLTARALMRPARSSWLWPGWGP